MATPTKSLPANASSRVLSSAQGNSTLLRPIVLNKESKYLQSHLASDFLPRTLTVCTNTHTHIRRCSKPKLYGATLFRSCFTSYSAHADQTMPGLDDEGSGLTARERAAPLLQGQADKPRKTTSPNYIQHGRTVSSLCVCALSSDGSFTSSIGFGAMSHLLLRSFTSSARHTGGSGDL